jgi:hypothetical protein
VRAYRLSSALIVTVSVLAAAPAFAESPAPLPPLPSAGFVPPYEIMRIVRGAGFEPLAPPLREGSTYVLRVTDFTGALLRVVVDGHSGAIRDTNRLMSGPGYSGSDGQIGMAYQAPAEEITTPFIVVPATSLPQAGDDGVIVTMHALVENPPLPRPRPQISAALVRTETTGKSRGSNKVSD